MNNEYQVQLLCLDNYIDKIVPAEEDSAELFSVFAADNSDNADKIKQQERHQFVSSTTAEILTSTYSGGK